MLARFETTTQRLTFVALLTLSLSSVGLAFLSVATKIGQPSPGFIVWQNLVVPAIADPGWPGTQARVPLRSVMVRADGRSIRDAAELEQIVAAAPVGTPLRYEFRDGDRLVEVTVPTTRWQWRDVLPVYLPYLIEGVAALVTALLIFFFRPAEPAARAGTALSAIVGLTLILALDVFSAAWLQRICFTLEWFVPAALLHFALCFPEPSRAVRRRPWLQWAPYALFALPAALQNWVLARSAEQHLAVNDWLYTADAIAGIASVVALLVSLVSSQTARARQQVRVVLTGMILAALVPALGLLSITLLGADVPMNWLTPFLLVYPFSIGYAIARHDLFSVDRYLRLSVSYAALSIVVFAAYAGVVLAGEAVMGDRGSGTSILVPVYMLLVLALANPMRDRIQGVVDRLFYRQSYDYRATVVATSQTLAAFLDTHRIADALLRTMTDEMSVEWTALVVLDKPSGAAQVLARPDAMRERVAAALPARGLGLDGLTELRSAAIHYAGGAPPRGYGGQSAGAVLLDRTGACLLLPLRFEHEFVGLLLLAEKLSRVHYSDEDLQLLTTLANQAALALVNARAYEIIRRTQKELVEAERMAAVGEMAAAVAHGIRNPLAGIRLWAELGRADLGVDQTDLSKTLDDIIGESDRLETRVRSILDLTRPVEIQTRPGDLATFLQDFVAQARERAPVGVDIKADLPTEFAAFPFDGNALGEVLETVATNAIEAMEESGHIVIRGEIANGGDRREAVISVSDDGPGMDEVTAAQVFDLFFTTKRSGTGVGLAMAKRLVERQGGSLSVETQPGAGATFAIRLPISVDDDPSIVGSR